MPVTKKFDKAPGEIAAELLAGNHKISLGILRDIDIFTVTTFLFLMPKILLLLAVAFINVPVNAQQVQAVNDAYVITRMAEKFHFQPKPLDDAFSAGVYNLFLNQLDPDKIFFTQEDINELSPYRYKLDEEIAGRKGDFLKKATALYQKSLLQTDTLIGEITGKPFNFQVAEKFAAAEDTAWATNAAARRTKLYKIIKLLELETMVERKDLSGLSAAQQKKYTDSIEPVVRKQVKNSFSRRIKIKLQVPGGVQQAAGEEYCKAIALYYDPHTEFLPLTEKENFESQVGQKSMAFGFSLDEDKDGNILIDDLKPGSPAYKSGQINKGDKIESVQWEGKEAIDLQGASREELRETLSASNHDKAMLKVEKADGTTREVTLWKESEEDDADKNKVKSFILKGSKTIGYLSLPAFYEDWENGNGVNGCANDVAKEIVKLKKENIEGLILDLRFNGGGSMQEAVELAGIFIDAGPVGQYKAKEPKAFTLKDVNRGTIYDGPMMVMVNGYSASASEVVAGTLQDYNRAVIVGSPTYGKATAQVVLPMDTTINMESDVRAIKTKSYVKVTVSQLYRITGNTAQSTGVIPDVLVPDVLQAQDNKEADEPFAIKANKIDANKYYKPLPSLGVSNMQVAAKNKINSSAFFNRVNAYIQTEKANRQKRDMPLQLSEALQQKNSIVPEIPSVPDIKTTDTLFSVQTHSFENQRVAASKVLQEMDKQWKFYLSRDPYVGLAYELMLLMPK